MQLFRRFGPVIIVFTFAILTFSKAMELWTMRTTVDGDGIGIHFLAFEINDRVLAEDIAMYSGVFLAISLVALIISITLLRKNVRQ